MMGGLSTSIWTLLISVNGICFMATLISANVTNSPTNVNNASQEACNATTLNQATSTINNAVDTLTTQLSCAGANNLPEVEFNQLQDDLIQIKDLTIKVFLYLSGVQDIFGVLNSLTTDNVQSVQFINLWFNIQLVPFLSQITGDFMTLLSTKDFSCSSYQALVKGLSDNHTSMDTEQQQVIFRNFIYPFLSRNNSAVQGCVSNTNGSIDWLQKNFGFYSVYATLPELHALNPDFSSVAVLDSLSPNQKAELILDPNSGALNNVTLVTEVFNSFKQSEVQLKEFFATFVNITKQENITIIQNTTVRDTMLNLTLTALAPEFKTFQPTDFKQWFQVNLDVLLASFGPGSLVVIPLNITCESYNAIYLGLDQSLASLPPNLSLGLTAGLNALMALFQKVNLCAGVITSQLGQELSSGSSFESLCNFNIPQYACSPTTRLSAQNLTTVLACELASNNTYSTAMWKLFFQNNAANLDQALLQYSSMNPNISSLANPQVLDAIEEVKINSFTDAQLNDASFINEWFTIKLRPFLASASRNFLSCLSSRNFSCQTYQTVIQALSSQSGSMTKEEQVVIFTYFIYPFLARNDSLDPGCVSNTNGSIDWLKKNIGVFSVNAELFYLQVLNKNLSILDSLTLLTPIQVAQWTLTPGVLNNTNDITLVFRRLEAGDAYQNVDTFLTELTANGMIPEIPLVVRDFMMNQTFTIISPKFQQFETMDWSAWFEVKLIPILPSFNGVMLTTATLNISCTNYQVIVQGLTEVFNKTPIDRRDEIAKAMLDYLTRSTKLINRRACTENIHNDTQWLETNLGLYSEYVTYSDLKDFNISGLAVLDYLTPMQVAEFILDPTNLVNETLVEEVFVWVLNSSDLGEIGQFFQSFANVTAMINLTTIEPKLRDTLLNMTLTVVAPQLNTLGAQETHLWFQVYLPLFLPGLQPGTFSVFPKNISCDSFSEIIKGFDNVGSQLSPIQSQLVYQFLMDYLTGQSEDLSFLTQPKCFRNLLQLLATRPSNLCNTMCNMCNAP
ncbi:hypothetical protein DPEC_G00311590 [Dallia pectoralis]|uniref:Uncharacterized protein n=1 Tax=Dallia pectoralis TaxID=75939 RepID=A0ACC2FBK9_DALPE|nr:hypothetical protein DPEC_G00311590 [Dallia pectoralis]